MSTYGSNQAMSGTIGSAGSINEISTEMKLRKFYEEEEGDMIVMEFCNDLMSNVMNTIQAYILTDQAQKFVVECALQAIKRAVSVNYCYHNVSYTEMGKDSWEADDPSKPSEADSWAAYRVPVTYDRESDEHIVEKKVEQKVPEEKHSRGNFQDLYSSNNVSASPSNSSIDILSIMDYLEDILSTSSDEEIDATSLINMIALDRISQHSGKFSAKLSAKLSQLSGKTAPSENDIIPPKLSHHERYMSSAFSKTALGDNEKGLCSPHVANLPVSNVVQENPEVEEFTLVKVEKRKTKVVRKGIEKNFPRRRSDTKLKMATQLEDLTRDKSKEKRK